MSSLNCFKIYSDQNLCKSRPLSYSSFSWSFNLKKCRSPISMTKLENRLSPIAALQSFFPVFLKILIFLEQNSEFFLKFCVIFVAETEKIHLHFQEYLCSESPVKKVNVRGDFETSQRRWAILEICHRILTQKKANSCTKSPIKGQGKQPG